MPVFDIDPTRVAAFAAAFHACRYDPAPYGFLAGWPAADRPAAVRAFLLFMVAIDHHTHDDETRYEGTVDGRFFHGSELLFMAAERAKRREPELFTVAAMTGFGEADARRVFASDEGRLPTDLAGRAEAMRDLATVLADDPATDPTDGPLSGLDRLTACARLAGPDGLIATLASLPGYGDRQAKKANLLAKTWMREGVWRADDPDLLALPVDHVVMTMALRGGLLRPTAPETEALILSGAEMPTVALAALRAATGAAYAEVARAASLPLADLDDLVWSYGRKALREPTPLPDPATLSSELDDRVDPAGRARFVAVLNGLDPGAPAGTAAIPQIRFAFTRDF